MTSARLSSYRQTASAEARRMSLMRLGGWIHDGASAPIISAAARNTYRAVSLDSVFARDGGSLSYGTDLVDIQLKPLSSQRSFQGGEAGNVLTRAIEPGD